MKADENRLMKRSAEVTIGWLSALFFLVGQLALLAPIEVNTAFGGSEDTTEVSSQTENGLTSTAPSETGDDSSSNVDAFAQGAGSLASVDHLRRTEGAPNGSISLLAYAPKLPPPFRFGRS